MVFCVFVKFPLIWRYVSQQLWYLSNNEPNIIWTSRRLLLISLTVFRLLLIFCGIIHCEGRMSSGIFIESTKILLHRFSSNDFFFFSLVLLRISQTKWISFSNSICVCVCPHAHSLHCVQIDWSDWVLSHVICHWNWDV